MITIVDYGMGNAKSVANMLRKVGGNCQIRNDAESILAAEKVILPGVGAFDAAMDALRNLQLIESLDDAALVRKVPILGICLGMQLLANSSDEGKELGLGWIGGHVSKFSNLRDNSGVKLVIPHMGWNELNPTRSYPLLQGLEKSSRFYFVHSYHFEAESPEAELATSIYGDKFTSAVQQENVMGVQFHPEKSHKYGMQLLRNFLNLQHAA
jgi:imidazole glycerol-phosphate synthase subunit HisH